MALGLDQLKKKKPKESAQAESPASNTPARRKLFPFSSDADTPQAAPVEAATAPALNEQQSPTPDMPVFNPEPISAVQIKPETNQRQTEDKLETKPETIQGQPKTNQRQTGDRKPETGDKLRTQPETNRRQDLPPNQNKTETNQRQTGDKPKTVLAYNVARLSGLRVPILETIFNQCQQQGTRDTGPITMEFIEERSGVAKSSLKKTLQRMELEGYIQRSEFKAGRGGWTAYSIPTDVWTQLTSNSPFRKLETNWRQHPVSPGPKLETEPKTNGSSKLVSNEEFNNSENTNLLTQALAEVSFAPVESLGITRSVIGDFQKNRWNITRYQLEQHIERFAVWASEAKNVAGVQNKRALFCRNIKSIATEGLDPLDFVSTAEDRALKALLEQRRAAMAAQKAQESELKALECDNWLSSLDESQKRTYVPETPFAKLNSEVHTASLRGYFDQHVWPGLFQKLKG